MPPAPVQERCWTVSDPVVPRAGSLLAVLPVGLAEDSRVGVQRSGLGRLSADPPEGGWNDPWKLFQGIGVLNHFNSQPDSTVAATAISKKQRTLSPPRLRGDRLFSDLKAHLCPDCARTVTIAGLPERA